MKAVTSTTRSPGESNLIKVPKPLMEKRRRDRINNSLETLRLLLLENTHNEKLRNPKVEKAEILECVVDLLRSDNEVMTSNHPDSGVLSGEIHNQSYREGSTSCLLRVCHFVSTRNRDLDESSRDAVSFTSSIRSHHGNQLHGACMRRPVSVCGQREDQHQLCMNTTSTKRTADSDATTLLSPMPMDISVPLWRPWP